MNFTDFRGIENSDSYFWEIAIPVGFVVALFLGKDVIKRMASKWANKMLIRRARKRRND
jgi:hypothetical protein